MQDASSEEGIRISIRVTGEGDFTYDPTVKRVHAGQSVTWVSSQGPFSIEFKKETPFDKLDYHSVKGEKDWSVTTREIEDSRGPGHFHYAVAIYIREEDRVFLDAGCPEIIVN